MSDDPPHLPPLLAPPRQRPYFNRFTKQDCFPTQSFQTLSAYKLAVSQTLPRLRTRLFSRSTDSAELDSRHESQNEMKRCLTWWDLLWLAFGSVVGSGIFVITGQEARIAGPSVTLSYAASGLSALLSVFCYTEFAVEIPAAGGSFSYLRVELGDFIAFVAAGNILLEAVLGAAGLATGLLKSSLMANEFAVEIPAAGGSFSYLRVELGDFIAFVAAGNILLEAVLGAAGLGRSWSSYFASIINPDNTDFLRIRIGIFAEGFNLLDPLAVAILAITNSIAMSGTKRTSCLNWISSIISALVIVFIIIVGFVHSDWANLTPFFPEGAEGVFQAAAVVYWSYTGFDMVATMAEETKNPSRDIPIGLIGSMSVITVLYCLMALALTMMVKYTEIDANAAYSVAFDQIGMKWAKYVVGICALKGMTTSLLVGSMGQARYTTQIARAHMIPPWFALVHPKTGTPINATLFVTIISCVVALFTSLDVLSSVFSFSTLFIFMLIAVALLVRRYYVKDVTSKKELMKFIACLLGIIGSSIGVTALWNSNSRGWVGYTVAGLFWFVGTVGMMLLPKQRVPKVWGVPLVPWLPSVSIGMNLFLIGSLGWVAFLRFFICSAVMLLYYLFVGLHATYDLAYQNRQESKFEDGKGNDNQVTVS